MKKHTARIDNWRVMGDSLWGNVTKHTLREFNPECLQRTSVLLSINEDACTAETENTIYTLGTKSKEKY